MITRTQGSSRSHLSSRAAGWLAVAGLVTLALAGCTPTPVQPGSAPQPDAPLHTASSSLGEIVVDGAGMTAYVFDSDTAGSESSACSGMCVAQWPAITADSETPEVEGITGTIDTIDTANGTKQVTLDGLPLYTYAGDSVPGDVNGQGVEGIWWVVDPSGAKITEAPPMDDRGY